MHRTLALYTLLLAGCTYPVAFTQDSPPNDADVKEESDARPQHMQLGWGPVVDDAGPDVAAPLDAGQDAPIQVVDASPEASSPEAAPPLTGGDSCPGLQNGSPRACGAGFAFRVTDPNGPDDVCGSVTPHCPTGWKCWGFNNQNVIEYHTCP